MTKWQGNIQSNHVHIIQYFTLWTHKNFDSLETKTEKYEGILLSKYYFEICEENIIKVPTNVIRRMKKNSELKIPLSVGKIN